MARIVGFHFIHKNKSVRWCKCFCNHCFWYFLSNFLIKFKVVDHLWPLHICICVCACVCVCSIKERYNTTSKVFKQRKQLILNFHDDTGRIFSQINKMLNSQCHGIFSIIWRHIKFFTKCFHGKSVSPAIWRATGKERPARFLETVILCEAFRRNFAILAIIWYQCVLFLCQYLFNISVRLFSRLLSLYNAIFSFSFNTVNILLLMLYAWCLPKTSHVMFVLRVLSFIFQNLLDSPVSD